MDLLVIEKPPHVRIRFVGIDEALGEARPEFGGDILSRVHRRGEEEDRFRA